MDKLFIKNRRGKDLSVIIEHPPEPRGLAFIMHGLGGFKEQPQLEAWASTFISQGYTVVRFDAANTFGESEGDYKEATISNYYEDLEDVIARTSGENFYSEPFVLMGHSLGGICTALYAQKYPEKVLALAPASTVVSGLLSFEAYGVNAIQSWKKSGWLERTSASKPGLIKKLPWSHMENRLEYNLLREANKLNMPVLLMVGSEDTLTPPAHQKILYDYIPGKKELHIIPGAHHTFTEKIHLNETSEILNRWISGLNNTD